MRRVSSVDSEKIYGKIQHLFLIKPSRKLEIEVSQPSKGYQLKPTGNIILNGETLNAFLLKSEKANNGSHHLYPTLYWRF